MLRNETFFRCIDGVALIVLFSDANITTDRLPHTLRTHTTVQPFQNSQFIGIDDQSNGETRNIKNLLLSHTAQCIKSILCE